MSYNVEAERQTIGGVIQAPAIVYPKCKELGITKDHFFDLTCRALYTEIEQLDDFMEAGKLDEILARSVKEGSRKLSAEAFNMRSSCINARLSMESASKVSELYAQRQSGAMLTGNDESLETNEKSPVMATETDGERFMDRLRGMVASTPENIDKMRERSRDAVFIMPGIALAGQYTIINAQYSTGKTLLTLWLLSQRDRAATGDYEIFYVNADDTFDGGIEKGCLLETMGVHSLIPSEKQFDERELYWLMESAIKTEKASGIAIILDTLKKWTDPNDKKGAREFNILVRKFVQAGGSFIALAHTNKKKGINGKSIAEGVGDWGSDCDCNYIVDAVDATTGDRKAVVFKIEKMRGPNVMETTFTYDASEGKSWMERFDSVEQLGKGQANNLISEIEAEEKHHEDMPIIQYLEHRIYGATGPVTGSALCQTDMGEDLPSRSQRERVLNTYSDANPRALHRHWRVRTGKTNGKVYSPPDKFEPF